MTAFHDLIGHDGTNFGRTVDLEVAFAEAGFGRSRDCDGENVPAGEIVRRCNSNAALPFLSARSDGFQ